MMGRLYCREGPLLGGRLVVLLLTLLPMVQAGGAWDKWIVFPAVRCWARFLLLNFDVTDYDRYPEFFREDSALRQIETGSFQGLDNILEYVVSGAAESSYYIQDPITTNLDLQFVSYDPSTTICEFQIRGIATLTSDPAVTGVSVRYSSGTLAKIYMNLAEGYVTEQRNYLSQGFWADAVRVVQSTPQVKDFLCDIYETTCAGQVEPVDDCRAAMDALPWAIADEDGILRYQTNSLVCRALHGNLAVTNPTVHCPHMSFPPGRPDPTGSIKCQAMGKVASDVKALDLFTQDELDSFQEWQLANGLPESGTIIEYLEE